MTGGVFVVSTGTDVGKTYVAALLVRYYREKGVNAGYFKAALSGAERLPDGSLLPGDAETVCRIGGLSDPPEALVPYVFEEAVSPIWRPGGREPHSPGGHRRGFRADGPAI